MGKTGETARAYIVGLTGLNEWGGRQLSRRLDEQRRS